MFELLKKHQCIISIIQLILLVGILVFIYILFKDIQQLKYPPKQIISSRLYEHVSLPKEEKVSIVNDESSDIDKELDEALEEEMLLSP